MNINHGLCAVKIRFLDATDAVHEAHTREGPPERKQQIPECTISTALCKFQQRQSSSINTHVHRAAEME